MSFIGILQKIMLHRYIFFYILVYARVKPDLDVLRRTGFQGRKTLWGAKVKVSTLCFDNVLNLTTVGFHTTTARAEQLTCCS